MWSCVAAFVHWLGVAVCGRVWSLMSIGPERPGVAVRGRFCPLAQSGRVWPLVAACDQPCVAVGGRWWPRVIGRVWLLVVVGDCVWLLVVVGWYFLF